jgi:AcrR family transcriptional regulator
VRGVSAARLPRGQGHLLAAEILRATVELLDETNDADAVSVRSIAARVGRSTPLVYEHFADRMSLLRAAARSALDDMAAAVERDVGEEADVIARLRLRAQGYMAFARRHPEPYRLLLMDHRVPAAESLDEFIDTTGLNGVARDLRIAQDLGLVRSGDVRSITVALWAGLHGVASLVLTHPDMDWPDDLLDLVLSTLRDGLRPTSV